MYTFDIPAARVRPHQSLALHLMLAIVLFATGVLCSVLYWFTAVSPGFAQRIQVFGVLGLICFGTALLVGVLAMRSRSRNRPGLRLIEGMVLLAGAVIFFKDGWIVPAVLFGVLGIMAFAVHGLEAGAGTRQATLRVDASGIHRPFALRTRRIPWRELKAVLLRRSVLTIDCLDNRLFQYLVPGAGVDAAAFEAFCASQIEQAKDQRSKSDW